MPDSITSPIEDQGDSQSSMLAFQHLHDQTPFQSLESPSKKLLLEIKNGII